MAASMVDSIMYSIPPTLTDESYVEHSTMSGPIIRQYGVPNWDEIFGKKDEQPAKSQSQTAADNDADQEQQSDPPKPANDPKPNK
jgi:hypothetical protein